MALTTTTFQRLKQQLEKPVDPNDTVANIKTYLISYLEGQPTRGPKIKSPLSDRRLSYLSDWYGNLASKEVLSLDWTSWQENVRSCLDQQAHQELAREVESLFEAAYSLLKWICEPLPILGLPVEEVRQTFCIAFYLALPSCFSESMVTYYSYSLAIFDRVKRYLILDDESSGDVYGSLLQKGSALDPFIISTLQDSIDMDDEEEEEMDEEEVDLEALQRELGLFDRCCIHARELGLIETRFLQPLFTHVLYRQIEQRLNDTAKGLFTRPMLRPSLKWLRLSMSWMRRIGGQDMPFENWYTRLAYHLIRTLAKMRLVELFDIVIYYPDSIPALEDLGKCKQVIDLSTNELVEKFKESCGRRLLQPGPDTSDIIITFISTIKSMRILDPSGVLLDKVSEPIRKYLRTREDAIRCIVCGLVGDESVSPDLAEELGNAEVVPLDMDHDQDDLEGGEDWMPIPRDAGATRLALRSSDLVSILVNIYDSRELFTKEYQNLLAERLLNMTDFEITREVRNVELLKIRFGEASLHMAEVMLKDMTDSRRLAMDEERNKDECLQATVISKLFWPPVRQDSMKLPSNIEMKMQEYEGKFKQVKQARKLEWLKQLGRVTVEVIMEDGREEEFVCSPVQAAIIYQLSESPEQTSEELALSVEVPTDIIKANMDYWISKGIVIFRDGRYHVQEDMREGISTEVLVATAIEDSRGGSIAQEAQRAEMQMYWSFIQGMLGNLGPLPLNRIQNMLSMFVTEPNVYSKSEEELGEFLDALVRDDKLERSSGEVYKLK